MKPISKIVPSYAEEGHESVLSAYGDVNRMGEARRLRVLWTIVILLAIALGGTSWYAYRSIDHNAPLADQIPGVQTLAGTMDIRLKSFEAKMTDWANDQTSLTDRVARLEKTVSSNVKAVRNQAQSAAEQVGQRIRQEISESLQRVQNRIESVESTQREAHVELAAAQDEIGSLRQEIADLQKQNAERSTELQQTQTSVNRLNGQVVAINDHLVAQTDSLNTLNEEVEREAMTFELSTSRRRQVAPGIYVTVSHTDVAHQRVDGWIQLSDEGRIIWIRGLAAQQGLPFLIRSDNRTYDLVFTSVQQNGAAGYVLVPHSPQSPVTTAN